MEFFGILKGYDLQSMDGDKRMELFVEKGLYEPRISIKLSLDFKGMDQKVETPKIKPIPRLRFSLHQYLLKHFKDEIEVPYYRFFADLNDEMLGLGREMERTIALRHFKILSEGILQKTGRIIGTSKGKNGSERITNLPRMELLSWRRETVQVNLLDTPLLFPYLEGNTPYFEQIPEETMGELGEFIEFETVFKILENLNKTHLFEPNPHNNVQNLTITDESETKRKNPKLNWRIRQIPVPKKKTGFTDKAARNYLIENIFSKKP